MFPFLEPDRFKTYRSYNVLFKLPFQEKLNLSTNCLNFFRFSIYLSVIFPGTLTYSQMYRKFKKVVLGLLAHVTPSIFFRRILRSEALVYNSYFSFRTAVLRKLFDIRFSYKHYNFSRDCLLVKMASKTVTRAILRYYQGAFDWEIWIQILKSGFRIYNRTRNPKTDFNAEIMLRHLFLDFHFYRSIGKSEKRFKKVQHEN